MSTSEPVAHADATGRAPLTPNTRRATPEDLADLLRLDGLARAHLGPSRGGELYLLRDARPVPAGPSFLEELSDPDRLVLLGTIADSPVGYAIASVVELRDGYHLADISEIFVEADARDVGVGEALMEQLTAWAVQRGCDGMDARTLPGDRSTKNFFETFGLVARAITVHKDLRQS
jgi:GNAT superfamily N-acetyltransferase